MSSAPHSHGGPSHLASLNLLRVWGSESRPKIVAAHFMNRLRTGGGGVRGGCKSFVGGGKSRRGLRQSRVHIVLLKPCSGASQRRHCPLTARSDSLHLYKMTNPPENLKDAIQWKLTKRRDGR